MPSIVSIEHLSKTYASGHHALQDVTLDIASGGNSGAALDLTVPARPH